MIYFLNRPYTKEEKDSENNLKNSPTRNLANGKNSITGRCLENMDYSNKAIKDIIRHHLERTTGGSGNDLIVI